MPQTLPGIFCGLVTKHGAIAVNLNRRHNRFFNKNAVKRAKDLACMLNECEQLVSA